jgi:NIMA (never in mitosis gene a)-related kinase 1/4/5
VLHQAQIFHRDLKSANVFLNRDGTVKLGDMNVSKVAKGGLLYTQTGTPYYASPEVWRDQPYDSKSDIWSLGCVLYEAITLKPPFRAEDMQGLYKRVLAGKYTRIPSKHYSEDLARTLAELLKVDAQQRPSCAEILEMRAVRTVQYELYGGQIDDSYILDNQPEMLQTIKVPVNLLYLTD